MKACFRSILSLLASAACLGAQAGPVQTRFSVNLGALPTDKALAQLQEFSALPLLADAQVRQDVVYVNLQDKTIDDALEAIARATGASISRQKVNGQDTVILVRTGADEEGQAVEESRRRHPLILERIRQDIDRVKGYMESGMPDSDGLADRFSKFGDVLALVPSGDLMRMLPGERVVYSTKPNARQRAISSKLLDAARPLLEDALTRRRQQLKTIPNTLPEASLEKHLSKLIASETLKMQSKPEIVLLVLHKNRPSGGIATLSWLAPDFSCIASVDTRLPLEIEIKSTVSGSHKAYDWDAETLQLARHWRSLNETPGGQGATPPQSPALSTRASRPEDIEPLNDLVAKVLDAIASETRQSLVACIPDCAMASSAEAILSAIPISDLAARPAHLDLEVEGNDGILVLRPFNQHQARRERLDRRAAQRFFATLVSDPAHPLLELCDLAASSQPYTLESAFVRRLFELANPAAADLLRDNRIEQNWLVLCDRLVEAKSPGKLDSIPYSQTASVDLLDEVGSLIARHRQGPSQPQSVRHPGYNFFANYPGFSVLRGENLEPKLMLNDPASSFWERTLVMDPGWEAKSRLRITVTEHQTILASENEGHSATARFVSPHDLGIIRARRDDPFRQETRQSLPEYRVFDVCSRILVAIDIIGPEQINLGGILIETKPLLGMQNLSFAELPAEIRTLVEAGYQQQKEQWGRNGGGAQ